MFTLLVSFIVSFYKKGSYLVVLVVVVVTFLSNNFIKDLWQFLQITAFNKLAFSDTVKSLLVAAATINFRGFLLRPQFKGGDYLRAATIRKIT